MYTLTVETSFDAAHYLRGYQGKCANLHGHTWKIQVELQGIALSKIGILVDFKEVKSIVNNLIDSEFDHQNLNEHPSFQNANPTAENLSKYIFEELQSAFEIQAVPAELTSVTVFESDHCGATYNE